MKNKPKKQELERKARVVKSIIKGLVDETIDIPNKAIIFDTNVLIDIFTKKRIELIQFINYFKPHSVKELADLTNRTKQAVDRDLKMLERYDLLALERNGRRAKPTLKRKFLVMGITDIYPLAKPKKIVQSDREKEVVAQVYAGGINVNQRMSTVRP